MANDSSLAPSGPIAIRRGRSKTPDSAPKTDYLKLGDEVRLEMFDRAGRSIFGAIQQSLERRPA